MQQQHRVVHPLPHPPPHPAPSAAPPNPLATSSSTTSTTTTAAAVPAAAQPPPPRNPASSYVAVVSKYEYQPRPGELYKHIQPPWIESCKPYLYANSSPAQLDGLTEEDEIHLRAHTCSFISEMGKKTKAGQITVATASVYIQIFFTHYSFKAFDRLEIACACLFLANKVEERRKGVDSFIGVFFHERMLFEDKLYELTGLDRTGKRPHVRPPTKDTFMPPTLDSMEWEALRNRIYEYEIVIIDAIEYQFEVNHPYCMFRPYLEYITGVNYAKDSQAFIQRHMNQSGGIHQIAWNFANDSLRTTLCLRYPPSNPK